MSEPVSNVEIEDVLSSIRRLVSEENRPAARRDPQERPRKPSRLVLTPSLLVPVGDSDDSTDDPAEDPTQNIAADTAADQAQDHEDHAGDDAADDTDDAQADSPVSFSTERAGDPEPDQATDQPDDFAQTAEVDSDTLDLTNFQAESGAYLDLDADTNAGPETDTDTDTAPWANPDSTLFQAAESADDPEVMDLGESPDGADSEDVKAADDAQDDLDTSDSTEAAKTESDATEPGVAESDTTPDSADTTKTDATALVQDTATADTTTADDALSEVSTSEPEVPYNTATLSAKIAVLEAKIGQTQDQWEPDGETDDDYAGTPVETIEWQDHTEDAPETITTPEPEFVAAPAAEVISEPAPEPAAEQVADAPAGETLDFLPEDEAILDEDSLRELVSDIVRQELQGALGERITRNVRKLVRREIHRALTAQELD